MALSDEKRNQVKMLSQKGIMISQSASKRLNDKLVKRILDMRHPPMYVNDQFIEYMKGRKPDVGYTTIEAKKNIKSFTGVDGQVYYLTWSEERRLPQANADILVNRGIADRAS